MLSKRLRMVANMVTAGYSVADIGTDHGYVPIYLVRENISPFAYAMDINEGPLDSAKKNITAAGLLEKIKVIRSDGFEKFVPGMADSVIISGMGGRLIVDILKKVPRDHKIRELILSPHRDIEFLREYLLKNGWKIEDESMAKDSGKYYVALRCTPNMEDHKYSRLEYRYGRCLLKQKNDILLEYLKAENEKLKKILNQMQDDACKKKKIEEELKRNSEGIKSYG